MGSQRLCQQIELQCGRASQQSKSHVALWQPFHCAEPYHWGACRALSWRIFSTTTTILLAWVVLGGSKGMRWSDMLKLGGAEFIMKVRCRC